MFAQVPLPNQKDNRYNLWELFKRGKFAYIRPLVKTMTDRFSDMLCNYFCYNIKD